MPDALRADENIKAGLTAFQADWSLLLASRSAGWNSFASSMPNAKSPPTERRDNSSRDNSEELFAVVYQELRLLAAARRWNEIPVQASLNSDIAQRNDLALRTQNLLDCHS